MAQPKAPSTTKPSGSLTLGIKELHSTGLYSDLTIVCGGRKFKVHKPILHPQSSVFGGMLGGDFKEANQNTLALHEDDPEVLQVLLHHLYHFTYDDSSRVADSQAPFTVKVYAIADQYDVPAVRDMAASKLAKVLDPTEDLDGFIAAICAIDEYTADSTLWDIVIPKIMANINWLADDDKFFALIHDMPALNKTLLKYDKGLSKPGRATG